MTKPRRRDRTAHSGDHVRRRATFRPDVQAGVVLAQPLAWRNRRRSA